MNNNDELSIESDQIALNDTAGMDEIAEAIKEIERLKNGGAQKEEIQEEQEDDVEPEEEQEEEKEESQEQEVEEEEEPESKKAPKKLDKIWKIKRSRYKALAEKKAVEEENARLKEMLAESLNSGTYHYGKNVYSELEKAKESKRRAIEEGDIDASIEADINLNRAINNINELEKWTASEKQPQRQPEPRQSADDYDEIEREKAADWLDDHPELQPNSRQYNLGLATEVSQFIHHLDNGIEARGQRDLLYSEEYFDTIDKYIQDVNNRDKTEKNRKSLGSVGHVGSVRNSYGNANGKSSKTIQMTLTADEKKICAAGGISEKDWLKYKLEELQKGK
ncbi:hypothetical protein UFOVP51_77 [uncultured Caudovirales phage]|uniref:Uncharacterized protein n=1 Tax=uncultured Caudovirales phage TaxID=2100421 RepID=A0A6J5T9J4_9CAUD|nr:hypothetical protein UFOVP51_77 [uncultured Caudovirales phage]CAB4240835.1 hypothetical protein UFOVP34_29 [uncultured Caudovirales phage]